MQRYVLLSTEGKLNNSFVGGQLGLGNEFDFWNPTPVVHLRDGESLLTNDIKDGEANQWQVEQVACGLSHTAGIVSIAHQ